MSKPSKPKLPPIPPAQAIPEVGPEAEDSAIRRARRRSGYFKTILAGALSPASGGKTTLGGGQTALA